MFVYGMVRRASTSRIVATAIEMVDFYDLCPDGLVLFTDNEESETLEWDRFRYKRVVIDGRQTMTYSGSANWFNPIGSSTWEPTR